MQELSTLMGSMSDGNKHQDAGYVLDVFNASDGPADGSATTQEIATWVDGMVDLAQGSLRRQTPGIVSQAIYGLPFRTQPINNLHYRFTREETAIISRCASTGVLSPERTEELLVSDAGAALVPWMVAHQNARSQATWHALVLQSNASCDITDALIKSPGGTGMALVPPDRLASKFDQATRGITDFLDPILAHHNLLMPTNVRARMTANNSFLSVAADTCLDNKQRLSDCTYLSRDPNAANDARALLRKLPKELRAAICDRKNRRDGSARWLAPHPFNVERDLERGQFVHTYLDLLHDDPGARGKPLAELMTTYLAEFSEPWYQATFAVLIADAALT